MVHRVARGRTRLSHFTFTFHFHALEKEMATHSSVLALRVPGRGSLVGGRLWGRTELDMTEVTQQQCHNKPLVESSFLIRDRTLSLWIGNTDSKTLDYQRTNSREYQTVRTHTKKST